MRKILSVGVLVTSLLLLSPNAGLTNATDGESHIASHGDPFRSCELIGANSFGVNYPNTELEPWLATNPANPRNLVGSYQQDRWFDGGAKGLVAASSFNGGKSWKNVPLPFSECAGPFYGGNVLHYERASDPWNSFGVDGIAYAVSISVSNNGDNAVGAATSLDGGRSWTNQQTIIADSGADPSFPFNDKESVTADPRLAKHAYVVWDRSFQMPCSPGQHPHTPIIMERPGRNPTGGHFGRAKASPSQAQPVCFMQPTYFSRTVDGGIHWEKPRAIVPTAPDVEGTIANQIVVNPKTGTLYNFFTFIDFSQGFSVSVQMVFSTDQGLTWSARQRVSDQDIASIYDPRNRQLTLRAGGIVSPAIDPTSGQLYVAWEDARFNNDQNDQVVISTSKTGLTGTWSPPSLISPPGDPAAFTPTLVVNQLGQVGATFYDFRSLKPSTPANVLPTDTWFRRTDGPGVDFTHEEHLGRFNALVAPVAFGGFFIGDYEGLTFRPDDNSFVAFFSQASCLDDRCPASGNGIGAPTRGPDPQNIFAAVIDTEK